jgi:pyruvate formate lyase activating enzyme
MQGLIFDIQRFSVHDGPGIRTTVFMKGCPLRCAWCHNPEGLSPHIEPRYFSEKCIGCGACGGRHVIENAKICPADAITASARVIDTDELLDELIRDVDFYTDGGGVTFSGGECLMQSDFVTEVQKKLYKKGIHTVIDTSGCVPWENISPTLPYTDIYLYDVKIADSKLHKRYTGRTNSLILENLRRLDSAGARIWIRTPIIPDVNDSEEEMTAIKDIISTLYNVERVTLMPYHTLGKSKYETLSMTPPYSTDKVIDNATLRSFRDIFSSAGFLV